MTSVLLVRSSSGSLLSCRADGHAGYAAAGSDIVCSALSVLLRTTLQTLSMTAGLRLETESPVRGALGFTVRIERPSPEIDARLVYAGDFLEQGIGSLAEEYPDNVELRIQTGK